MHSSRMRTARPPDRNTHGQRPHWTETPLDRDLSYGQRPLPWTETPPLDSEPPGQRPLLWTETSLLDRDPLDRDPSPGPRPPWTETPT